MKSDEVFALLVRANPVPDPDGLQSEVPMRHVSSHSRPWWRPLAIVGAAAVLVIVAIGPLGLFRQNTAGPVGSAGSTLAPPTTSPVTGATTTVTTAPPTTSVATTTVAGVADRLVLVYGGETIADAASCRGADGAVVFRFSETSAMVGFENATFLRVITPDGAVDETPVVTVYQMDGGNQYRGTVTVSGTPVDVAITVPDAVELADCVSTAQPAGLSLPADGSMLRVAGLSDVGVHDRYVFSASAGETLTVAITSTGDAVNWGLRGPDGQPIKRVENETRNVETVLDQTGDYVVTIGSGTASVWYSLSIGVSPAG